MKYLPLLTSSPCCVVRGQWERAGPDWQCAGSAPHRRRVWQSLAPRWPSLEVGGLGCQFSSTGCYQLLGHSWMSPTASVGSPSSGCLQNVHSLPVWNNEGRVSKCLYERATSVEYRVTTLYRWSHGSNQPVFQLDKHSHWTAPALQWCRSVRCVLLISAENPGNSLVTMMTNVQWCPLWTLNSVDRNIQLLWLQRREELWRSTAELCASVEDTASISPSPGVKCWVTFCSFSFFIDVTIFHRKNIVSTLRVMCI